MCPPHDASKSGPNAWLPERRRTRSEQIRPLIRICYEAREKVCDRQIEGSHGSSQGGRESGADANRRRERDRAAHQLTCHVRDAARSA